MYKRQDHQLVRANLPWYSAQGKPMALTEQTLGKGDIVCLEVDVCWLLRALSLSLSLFSSKRLESMEIISKTSCGPNISLFSCK